MSRIFIVCKGRKKVTLLKTVFEIEKTRIEYIFWKDKMIILKYDPDYTHPYYVDS